MGSSERSEPQKSQGDTIYCNYFINIICLNICVSVNIIDKHTHNTSQYINTSTSNKPGTKTLQQEFRSTTIQLKEDLRQLRLERLETFVLGRFATLRRGQMRLFQQQAAFSLAEW